MLPFQHLFSTRKVPFWYFYDTRIGEYRAKSDGSHRQQEFCPLLVRVNNKPGLMMESGFVGLDDYLIEKPALDEGHHEYRIRCICLRDRTMAERKAWLSGLFPMMEQRPFDHDDTSLFSTHAGDFDILLFHGDDERRMSKAIRPYDAVLRSKAKIAFMSRSTPAARAVLLNAGFDDVFDSRMDHVEMVCRLEAIMRRINIRRNSETRSDESIDWRAVTRHCSDRLTKREAEIFSLLFRNAGNFVPFEELARSEVTSHTSGSRRALSVAMCKIRKKLADNVDLVSDNRGAYRLVVRPELGAD